MKQTTCGPTGLPNAYIALNKSRIKIYHKETNPTYYLEKGTEFMIELFNPTSDTVLAKIHLNGTAIAQGGLVLRPGERVFLERYVDVAKKFLFDTYNVSNTAEVRAAIKENGDLKVEFYKESKPYYNPLIIGGSNIYHNHYHYDYTYRPYYSPYYGPTYFNNTGGLCGTVTTAGSGTITTSTANSAGVSYNTSNASTYTSAIGGSSDAGVTMDYLSADLEVQPTRRLKSKSIETGRVEEGSSSSQKLEYISKSFDSYAFHTIEYKLLPLSQKVNSTEDLNVKRYCTSCGAKQKEGYKFCPTCGSKQ